jgi:hypothetical protein
MTNCHVTISLAVKEGKENRSDRPKRHALPASGLIREAVLRLPQPLAPGDQVLEIFVEDEPAGERFADQMRGRTW